MDPTYIIHQLERNQEAFRSHLHNTSPDEITWRSAPDKWCLLEIVCHLYDEEREDFRARLRHVLEHPEAPLPPIDPVGWVNSRHYLQQDYHSKVELFLEERRQSVAWLRSLQSPKWDNAHQHPKFGPMSGKLFLSNWLAHDYLHLRQIIRLRFEYLHHLTGEWLNYAGEW